MASCEKCWSDAGGSPERYSELLAERVDNHCTPEEQAGVDADWCPTCKRKTIHQHHHHCTVLGCTGVEVADQDFKD